MNAQCEVWLRRLVVASAHFFAFLSNQKLMCQPLFAGQLHGLTDFWIPFFLNTQDRLCQTELKSIEVNDRMLTRLFKAQTGVAKHQILVNAIHAHSNNSVLCSISLSQIEVECKVTSSNVYWSQARRCQQ
jgi:hypothetical protein